LGKCANFGLLYGSGAAGLQAFAKSSYGVDLTLAEAIAGYTTWAALAGFEEDWRGAIAPGYAADLTVFDRALDPADPASILQARVVRTIVAGRAAFVAGSGT
jgi:hypothetical protein